MYIHKVNYYETDKMGVTHHSNYIRWMEEARVDFLDKVGLSYDKIEALGIVSPVIGIECEYKVSTTFNDEIEIDVKVKEYKGVRMIIEYKMTNKNTGDIVLTGISKHCFINKENKPVRMKNEFPEIDEKLRALVE